MKVKHFTVYVTKPTGVYAYDEVKGMWVKVRTK